jgi:hypothetical protein
MFEEH